MEGRSSLLWLHTSSGWVPALADSDGHFQVDVLSCANPGNLDVALSVVRNNLDLYLARNVTWLYDQVEASGAIGVARTVTTGKKYYLAALSVHMLDSNVEGDEVTVYVRNASDVEVTVLLGMWGASAGILQGRDRVFPIPLGYPAGYDICVWASTSTCACRLSIVGWEE